MSEIGKTSKVVEIYSYGELKLFVEKNKRTILFVGTDWCHQSKSMARVLAKLSKRFPEVTFLVASLEDSIRKSFPAKKELKLIFSIDSYPTLLAFLGDEIAPLEKMVSEKSLEEQEKDVIALIGRIA